MARLSSKKKNKAERSALQVPASRLHAVIVVLGGDAFHSPVTRQLPRLMRSAAGRRA